MKYFDTHQVLETVEEIYSLLDRAGQAIRDLYHQTSIDTMIKSDKSPVTAADLLSNKIIIHGLNTSFPDIPIISEEIETPAYEQRKTWEYVWILDPLDGTKGFINKTGEFTINLALIQAGKLLAGFIYVPVQQQMYFAVRGFGAYEYQPEKEHRRLQARSFNKNDDGIRVLASRHHNNALTQAHINTLNHPEVMERGAALKFVSIADGQADYYPKMAHIMEWDTAPGQIILEEAGGSVVQVDNGQPLMYNKHDLYNPYFIASGKSEPQ